jgi:hypothetical protein
MPFKDPTCFAALIFCRLTPTAQPDIYPVPVVEAQPVARQEQSTCAPFQWFYLFTRSPSKSLKTKSLGVVDIKTFRARILLIHTASRRTARIVVLSKSKTATATTIMLLFDFEGSKNSLWPDRLFAPTGSIAF